MESNFEQLTGCVCSFCKTPIGGLEEVYDIFVLNKPHIPEAQDVVSFFCTHCAIPDYDKIENLLIN